MRAVVAISFICISAFGMSPDVIYEIASQYTSEPETIVSMALIESSHGINKVGDSGRSLGLLQLQCQTVLWFAKKHKSLMWLRRIPRQSLKNLLLHYDRLNVEIASKMLQWRINRYDYFIAVSRHNGGFKNYAYFAKVKRNLR